MSSTILEMTDVSFSYAKNAANILENISLKIDCGEFIALSGRNGSGKTTLTKLAMSLIKPGSGSIIVYGRNTAKLTPADIAGNIGYVFQNPDRQIFKNTVAEEVAYGPKQLGFSDSEIAEKVALALNMANLTSLSQAYPLKLTRGQKQRVAIASALSMSPKMLILDEPTSGQDLWERKRLLDILSELNKEGLTILIVTHDMELISKYAKRVLVICEGKKVFDSTPAELFSGGYDIEPWGLTFPTARFISNSLNLPSAANDGARSLAESLVSLKG